MKISDGDVGLVSKTIKEYVDSRSIHHNEVAHELNLDADTLSFLLGQLLIPFLVSVTSASLYDVLKGKIVSMLNEDESEKIISSIVGTDLNLDSELDEECLGILKDQFRSLGLNEDDVPNILADIKSRLRK
jgi:hypothetical protein